MIGTRLSCCDNCERGSNDNTKRQSAVPNLAAPVLRRLTNNGTVLSQILLQVRDASSHSQKIHQTCCKDSIANAAALAKMARIPPQNFDEFRSLGLHGFTIKSTGSVLPLLTQSTCIQ